MSSYNHWTKDEEQELARMVGEGMVDMDIAYAMNRSLASITVKRQKLGIKLVNKRKYARCYMKMKHNQNVSRSVNEL